MGIPALLGATTAHRGVYVPHGGPGWRLVASYSVLEALASPAPSPTPTASPGPPPTPSPSPESTPTPTPRPEWAGSHAPYGETGYRYHHEAGDPGRGYPCGGKLPTCQVLECESGGNPKAENPRSSASGLWMFIDGTWNHYGGYHHASDAPPAVQNDKAVETWANGEGRSHWRACL